MPQRRRKYDEDFREGAVQIVLDTGRPIAEVARELGIHEATLGHWVDKRRGPDGLLTTLFKRLIETAGGAELAIASGP